MRLLGGPASHSSGSLIQGLVNVTFNRQSAPPLLPRFLLLFFLLLSFLLAFSPSPSPPLHPSPPLLHLFLFLSGYPLLVLHRHARRIFSTSLRSSDFDDVVSCRGDEVALAVTAAVTLYPENVAATWLMFAVRHKAIL